MCFALFIFSFNYLMAPSKYNYQLLTLVLSAFNLEIIVSSVFSWSAFDLLSILVLDIAEASFSSKRWQPRNELRSFSNGILIKGASMENSSSALFEDCVMLIGLQEPCNLIGSCLNDLKAGEMLKQARNRNGISVYVFYLIFLGLVTTDHLW